MVRVFNFIVMGIVKDNLYRISGKRFLSLIKKQSIFPYYHIVRDTNVEHIENLYRYKNVKQFEYDLDFLLKNYKRLNPNDLFKDSVPENSFLITFDDGLEEIYSVIFPILKRKNLSAIFFLNPDFVGNKKSLYKHDISIIVNAIKKNSDVAIKNKIALHLSVEYSSDADLIHKLKNIQFSDRHKLQLILSDLKINMDDYLNEKKPYISKDQIKEMLNAGFYFGGHTMSHPPLVQLSFEEQKAEIINSIEWVKTNFGIDYSLFAFPFSDAGISKKLINELFAYDPNIRLFGNSGLKKDFDNRIIQRFSLEHPDKKIEKQIVTENLYKYFNKLIGKYHIKRK